MNRSEQIECVAAALSKAQAAFETIIKDKIAKITSAKGSYQYKYADLAAVLSAIRPAMAANELSLIQTTDIDEKGYLLTTMLMHSSGQWLASKLRLSDWPDPKQLGIEMSYLRRYSACALLGVASEDDTDSDGLDTKRPAKQQKPDPEATPPKGLNEALAQELLDAMSACEEPDTLRAAYTSAYKTAGEAGDKAAAQKFLEAYRAHPKYVAPQPKQQAVT